MSVPGFTFLSSWECGEAASGLPYPALFEVCPGGMRMPVACSQPYGICPQGMQDMPAACPQPPWAMQVTVTQASAGAGLYQELLGIGTTECVTKLLEQGLAN